MSCTTLTMTLYNVMTLSYLGIRTASRPVPRYRPAGSAGAAGLQLYMTLYAVLVHDIVVQSFITWA